MAKYIINKNAQADGYHEVHNEETCNHLPDYQNRIDLGNFYSCTDAVASAKRSYPSHNIDGCYYCCNECHTR